MTGSDTISGGHPTSPPARVVNTPEAAVSVLADCVRYVKAISQELSMDRGSAGIAARIATEIDEALARTAPFSGAAPGAATRSRIMELVELIRGLRSALEKIIVVIGSDATPHVKADEVIRVARGALNRLTPWVGL